MAINDRLFSTNRKKRKLKDKKIQFYQNVQLYDPDYGTPLPGGGFQIIFNDVWAYARQTSAREVYEYKAGAVNTDYEVDMLFTINYRTGIKNDMVIRYRDDMYSITRVDYFEGYKEDILISATHYTGTPVEESELVPFGIGSA